MMKVVLFIVIIVSFVNVVSSQRGGDASEDGPGGNRRIRRRKKALAQHSKALTINFPLNLFSHNPRDWKTKAVYNAGRVERDKSTKPWTQYARAQDQEDIWLYEHYFYGMEHGVVMESGALDGKLFSNSYLFEQYANWTALHVEADPTNYGNLILNRPDAINVNGALCSEPTLLHYSSFGVIPVRGFVEFMSESFLKKWHGPIYNKKVNIDDLPTVQCLPVRNLLQHLGVKHIDLWILDVEGAEESVLKGTDFNAVTINAVAMECDEHDVDKNGRKTSILEANGFSCKLEDRNCMCLNKNFRPSQAPEFSKLKRYNGHTWV
jgi:hypothetical protein